MLTPSDPRYYDLTSRVLEKGISGEDLSLWLQLRSMHPFTERLSEQPVDGLAKEMINKYGADIPLYYIGFEQGTFYFKVHIGTVSTFCRYLGLPILSPHDCLSKNLKTMPKPFDLPHGSSRSFDIGECKRLWQSVNKMPAEIKLNPIPMICLILDHDYDVMKNYS